MDMLHWFMKERSLCTNKARFSWVTIINTWDEKKLFKCDICDKTFVAVHDRNKSFICLICKKISNH